MSPATKTCTKCGEAKALRNFSKQKAGKFGVTSRCKNCVNVISKQYAVEYEKTPQRIASKKVNDVRFKKENRNRVREQSKRFKKNNPEKTAAWNKSWRLSNSDKVKAGIIEWRTLNPEKVRVLRERQYEKQRLATQLKHLGEEPDWVTVTE